MTGDETSERRARVSLSFLATPGDLALGAALRYRSAAEVLAAVTGTSRGGELALAGQMEGRALAAGVDRWRARLSLQPSVAKLAAWYDSGLRLVCPGDPDWPTQLDDLGDARPLLLWVRGTADVRFACLNSVSVVGARAATAYGNHVALEMAAALTEHGMTVISGGAKGTLFQRKCTSSTGGLFMRKPGLIARWGVTLGWSVTYTGSVTDGS
jgi:DNA processing protein